MTGFSQMGTQSAVYFISGHNQNHPQKSKLRLLPTRMRKKRKKRLMSLGSEECQNLSIIGETTYYGMDLLILSPQYDRFTQDFGF
jgi:hypothetical protein